MKDIDYRQLYADAIRKSMEETTFRLTSSDAWFEKQVGKIIDSVEERVSFKIQEMNNE